MVPVTRWKSFTRWAWSVLGRSLLPSSLLTLAAFGMIADSADGGRMVTDRRQESLYCGLYPFSYKLAMAPR